MTVYEFNQAGYANLPDMKPKQIEVAGNTIIKSYLEKHDSSYYLLLNNDLHYYTFFVVNEFTRTEHVIDELITLVKDLGHIKSIEDNGQGGIEFWVQDKETIHMFMFFDYKRGVIEIP